MKLIGFMGAPGSGKTTLACAMKEYVLHKGFNSDVATEYAREYCFKYGVPSDPSAQYHIVLKQVEREDLLLKGKGEFVFSDSPVWLSYIFTMIYAENNSSPNLKLLIGDVYNRYVLECANRYDKVFYLRNDNPYDDSCRNLAINAIIDEKLNGFVNLHKDILPIIKVDISASETERRKEFIWQHINPRK